MTELIQIFSGLGAGNIGDEMMMHGFWSRLPPDIHLHVMLHENSRAQRQPYPERFRYRLLGLRPGEFELAGLTGRPGLLAGTTPVTDAEGWEWPLAYLAPRLRHFHDQGLPVDAVGIGADRLVTPEGRRLFENHFRRIRSWSVRNEQGRDALLEAGVEPDRIVVGADWAWLYEPPGDAGRWAADMLAGLGIRVGEPLLVVNLFWQGGGTSFPIWDDVAQVLDRLHFEDGLQIVFFCNECRHPGFDRTAAESLQSRMAAPSALIPNLYYGPGEALALLRHATVTLGQRYHFFVESVAAQTAPVMLGRSPKIEGLCREFGMAPLGTLAAIDGDEVIAAVRAAIRDRAQVVALIEETRRRLARRALNNLDLFARWHGLAGSGL